MIMVDDVDVCGKFPFGWQGYSIWREVIFSGKDLRSITYYRKQGALVLVVLAGAMVAGPWLVAAGRYGTSLLSNLPMERYAKMAGSYEGAKKWREDRV